jgi:large subunit ribosomal protein L25
MATDTTTKLSVRPRSDSGSRGIRRLRRAGIVPGVVYGGGKDPVSFEVGERELRHALAASGAVIEVELDGASTPVVLKDRQAHPVRGETMHVDFVRVDLNVAIQAPVPVVLEGGDDAPGVAEGGILTTGVTELNVEALPNDIPENITVDVSGMEAAGTLTLADITAPQGVTFLDDPEATIIASITTPDVEEETDEVETETEVVGEGAGEAEGSAEDADASDVPAEDGGE